MESINDLIKKLKKQLSESAKAIEKKNDSEDYVNVLKGKIDELGKTYKGLNDKIKKYSKNIDTHFGNGITIEVSATDICKNSEDEITLQDLPKRIWKCIYNQDLSYSPEFIENIVASLRSQKILIFSGTSGCGKSALIHALEKYCGAKLAFISVKPNWYSPDDLFGYYDHSKNKYIPSTEFIKTLMQAKQDSERLHIIALDEINLARVEYYFADILSQLESKKDPKIFLYKEVSVSIPSNVRFIGTMNIDDTTYYLSPKILDRVHIIRFENPLLLSEKIQKTHTHDEIELGVLSYSKYFKNQTDQDYFKNEEDKDVFKKVIKDEKEELKKLNNVLEEYQKDFGHRVQNQFVDFLRAYKQLGLDINTGVENFIHQKILPRIHLHDKFLCFYKEVKKDFDLGATNELYERWVVVKILNTLWEEFESKKDGGRLEIYATLCGIGKEKERCILTHKDLEYLKVTISYDKELSNENKKKPDILLLFEYTKTNSTVTKELVIDAKYYKYDSMEDLLYGELVTEIIEEKESLTLKYKKKEYLKVTISHTETLNKKNTKQSRIPLSVEDIKTTVKKELAIYDSEQNIKKKLYEDSEGKPISFFDVKIKDMHFTDSEVKEVKNDPYFYGAICLRPNTESTNYHSQLQELIRMILESHLKIEIDNIDYPVLLRERKILYLN